MHRQCKLVLHECPITIENPAVTYEGKILICCWTMVYYSILSVHLH